METPSNWWEFAGGRKRATGEIGGAIDFGWVPNPDPEIVKSTITRSGNVVQIFEDVNPDEDVPEIKGDRVLFWEWVRAACAKMPSGLIPLYNGLPAFNWQLTGSCVNGGGFNALMTRIAIETIVLPEPESFTLPFTLLSYGASRWNAFRDASEGEGSSGDQMAVELSRTGFPAFDAPGLPKPIFCGPAVAYSRAVELAWSSVRNHPEPIKALAKPHTITYGICKSADDVEKESRRLRPWTFAGDWGGSMTGVVKGTPPVLMMARRETWNHQQSGQGFMYHPELGRIFRIQNQWFMPGRDMEVHYINTRDGRMISEIVKAGNALPLHGENPDAGFNGPPGGYWVTERDVDYQCKTGQVRSIKSVKGFTGVVDLGRI